MTDLDLQTLIASVRQNIYAWCGAEAIEKIERLIRYVEHLHKGAQK